VVAKRKYLAARVGLLRHRKRNCHFDDGISLMKLQFVASHTARQTDAALLDSWVTSSSSVKMLCAQKNFLSFYFRKNVTCFSVGLLRIGQFYIFFCLGELRQLAVS
jgi:hypothetical protein